jgi:hypothetical protein
MAQLFSFQHLITYFPGIGELKGHLDPSSAHFCASKTGPSPSRRMQPGNHGDKLHSSYAESLGWSGPFQLSVLARPKGLRRAQGSHRLPY